MAAQAWNNVERLGEIEEQRHADRLAREDAQAEARQELVERYKSDCYRCGGDMAEAIRLHGTEQLGDELMRIVRSYRAGFHLDQAKLVDELDKVVTAHAESEADDDLRRAE